MRVNDRGPFHPGRVIDLSYAAAYRIGIAQKGSGEVEVESILPAEAPPHGRGRAVASGRRDRRRAACAGSDRPGAGGYVVQLGAFANNANAQNFAAHLANQTDGAAVEAKVRQIDGLFRVYVGPYPTREDARRALEQSARQRGPRGNRSRPRRLRRESFD